jgi:hypothetical protein
MSEFETFRERGEQEASTAMPGVSVLLSVR